MKIEIYLTGSEIQTLREAMDSLPLVPYAPVILKVLEALPMKDITPTADNTDREFSELDALVEFQRNRNKAMERFDASLSEGMQELRRGNPLYDLEWYV